MAGLTDGDHPRTPSHIRTVAKLVGSERLRLIVLGIMFGRPRRELRKWEPQPAEPALERVVTKAIGFCVAGVLAGWFLSPWSKKVTGTWQRLRCKPVEESERSFSL